MLSTFLGMNSIQRIIGDFRVSNNITLTNFSGLNSLVDIEDRFVVSDNDMISNFNGLQNLEFIGDNFELTRNENLTSLEGLDNLSSIDGTLVVRSNQRLKNMKGLEFLNTITEGLSLLDCEIATLEGLDNVRNLGHLLISPANNLSNLSGLEGLERVVDFRINGNGSLLSLTGLGLTTITGDLNIQGTNIRTLGGLEALIRVQGELHLDRNNDLETIGSLSNLEILDGNLFIQSTAISLSLIHI